MTTDVNALKALARDETNDLIIDYLTTDGPATPATLFSSLTNDYNIKHIDVLIVNAGNATFTPTLETSMQSIRDSFEINTFLTIALFQALHPLLVQSNEPKFIYISSAIGSIELLADQIGALPVLAYGAAKAASAYFTRKVHFEFPGFVSLTLHPGYVRGDLW